MREGVDPVGEAYLKHLSPLGWEHINLTGDYSWEAKNRLQPGEFCPLKSLKFTYPVFISVLRRDPIYSTMPKRIYDNPLTIFGLAWVSFQWQGRIIIL